MMETTENNYFGEWIDTLEIGIYPETRKKIIEECKITPQVFRHWKNGNSRVPNLAKPIIEEIAGKQIFKPDNDEHPQHPTH